MNNIELVEKLEKLLTLDTLYVNGGQGQPLNVGNRLHFISKYPYNAREDRAKLIRMATSDTFAFDCIGMIKSVLWGFSGDKNRSYGGAVYASNGVPDISEDNLITKCNPSTNFNNIVVGAYVWLQGHCGIYIGDGYVIECSPKWEDGVQTTVCSNHPEDATGYARKWTKWGKLPYVEYVEDKELKKTLKVKINGIIKEVNAIENGNENYIRLRDFDTVLGLCKVDYDSAAKMPVVEAL